MTTALEPLRHYQSISQLLFKYNELKPFAATLDSIVDQLDKPLELMVMGEFNAGKSTFINALLQSEVLKSDATPATALITKLIYGDSPRLTVHYKSGEVRELKYQQLHSLSAEGDIAGGQERAKISYLELALPNEILKEISIIDTPGLNSQNADHTKMTQQFLKKTDAVIWLFSYNNVGKNSELSVLKRLSDNLTPYGVVNCIDDHDPEEESLEAFLEVNYKRLKGMVSGMVGVSALRALQGYLNKKNEWIKESGMGEVEQLLSTIRLEANSKHSKSIRFKREIEEFASELQKEMAPKLELFVKEKKMLLDYDGYKDEIQQEIEALRKLHEEWYQMRKSKKSTLYREAVLPANLNLPKELQDSFEQQKFYFEELTEEKDKHTQRIRIYESKRIDLRDFKSRLDADWHAYNHSGIIFNKPLLDWSGKKAALKVREEEYHRRDGELYLERERLASDKDKLESKWARGLSELRDIGRTVEKTILAEIKRRTKAWKDRSDLRKAIKAVEGHLWISESMLNLEQQLIVSKSDMSDAFGPFLAWLKAYGLNKSDHDSIRSALKIRKSELRRQTAARSMKACLVGTVAAGLVYFGIYFEIYQYVEGWIHG